MTFAEHIGQLLSPDDTALLLAALASTPTVSVRANLTRGAVLRDDLERVPWCNRGAYLAVRPMFALDPAWHSGLYYVQDASSMFISHVIGQLITESVRYLDLCAAPGGKTTAAIDALPRGSVIVANEFVAARALALCDNVSRWGNPSVIVTGTDTSKLARALPATFDVVAVDAPCSGEGMMRKDDTAVKQWSPSLVKQCAELQRAIITDAWKVLKPGGLLIYSTCTFNREENEEQVEFIAQLGGNSVAVPIDPSWNILPGIDTPHHCYRFMPHHTRGEGLFMAVMLKTTENDSPINDKASKATKPAKLSPHIHAALNWLNTREVTPMMTAYTLCAVNTADSAFVSRVTGAVHTLQAGVPLRDMRAPKPSPHHALAYSTLLAADAFTRVNVDRETAVRYLRGEAITLADAPRGDVIVCYDNIPLGFARNLGARANNLYPKPWRIITQQTSTPPASPLKHHTGSTS